MKLTDEEGADQGEIKFTIDKQVLATKNAQDRQPDQGKAETEHQASSDENDQELQKPVAVKSEKEVFFEETFDKFDVGNKGELNLEESKDFINLMVKTFIKDKTNK